MSTFTLMIGPRKKSPNISRKFLGSTNPVGKCRHWSGYKYKKIIAQKHNNHYNNNHNNGDGNSTQQRRTTTTTT